MDIIQEHGVNVATIHSPNGESSASFVPEFGGIASSLILPGSRGRRKEMLFRHDHFWDPETTETRGGLPFLFPICGRLIRGGRSGWYMYKGRPYHLPIHGFSLHLPWQLGEGGDAHSLELRLQDSGVTRKHYPFAFEVRLTYTIEDRELGCRIQIHNPGPEILPMYGGFHPYFVTPTEKGRVTVAHHPTTGFRYNGSSTDVVGQRDLPTFPQPVNSVALNGLLTASPPEDEMELVFPDRHRLGMQTSEHYGYVQHYTMTSRPFYCYEPWMGHPNGLNTLMGHEQIQPGETHDSWIRIWSH